MRVRVWLVGCDDEHARDFDVNDVELDLLREMSERFGVNENMWNCAPGLKVEILHEHV